MAGIATPPPNMKKRQELADWQKKAQTGTLNSKQEARMAYLQKQQARPGQGNELAQWQQKQDTGTLNSRQERRMQFLQNHPQANMPNQPRPPAPQPQAPQQQQQPQQQNPWLQGYPGPAQSFQFPQGQMPQPGQNIDPGFNPQNWQGMQGGLGGFTQGGADFMNRVVGQRPQGGPWQPGPGAQNGTFQGRPAYNYGFNMKQQG